MYGEETANPGEYQQKPITDLDHSASRKDIPISKLLKPPKPPVTAVAKPSIPDLKIIPTKPAAPITSESPKPISSKDPSRPSSASKSTKPTNQQAAAQSLTAFRETLSSRQQARQQSRQSLKEKQEKAKQEKIEEADRQREQILREMKEKDKEERRRREKEREEREAKRKQRELAEEAEREAALMAEHRWNSRVVGRIFGLLKTKVEENKQREAIAAYTHNRKRTKRVLSHLMVELRERLKPQPVDYTPAIEHWQTQRLRAGMLYWKLAVQESKAECRLQLETATVHRKSSLWKAWKQTRVVLQREKWLTDKSNNSKVKQFRLKQQALKIIQGWHEVVREQIKQKMYEQDKTKYMSKVQDWLKEFETQQQLRGGPT